MESRARYLMRHALYLHYESGGSLKHASLVEQWLKDHKGWFSEKEFWCLLPVDVHSDHPEIAVKEASRISLLLLQQPTFDFDSFQEGLESFLEESLKADVRQQAALAAPAFPPVVCEQQLEQPACRSAVDAQVEQPVQQGQQEPKRQQLSE